MKTVVSLAQSQHWEQDVVQVTGVLGSPPCPCSAPLCAVRRALGAHFVAHSAELTALCSAVLLCVTAKLCVNAERTCTENSTQTVTQVQD